MGSKKKSTTKKLSAQTLEKRKAPFASPIRHREGDVTSPAGGDGVTETYGSRRGNIEPEQAPTLPRSPIVHRTN